MAVWAVLLVACAVPPADDGNHDDTGTEDAGDVACDPATSSCKALGQSCAAGDECASGHCADGLCCDTACGDSRDDCQACTLSLTGASDGRCTPLVAATECRASTGPCDFAEVCDGSTPTCPGDVLLPAGIVCRGAADACDVEESCTGVSAGCPLDKVKPAATACRDAAGPCDLADTCDGASSACPNALQPNGVVCRPTQGETCDAPDTCDGTSVECVERYLSGVECRAATGACDIAEVCFGTAPTCPPDQVVSAGLVCRAALRTQVSCDPAESCDGVASQCPADVEFCP